MQINFLAQTKNAAEANEAIHQPAASMNLVLRLIFHSLPEERAAAAKTGQMFPELSRNPKRFLESGSIQD